MHKNPSSSSGLSTSRVLAAILLCATGMSLGILSFAQNVPREKKFSARTAVTAAPGFHAVTAMPGSNAGTEPSLAIPQQVRAGLRFVTWQNPGEIATSLDGVNFT